MPEKYLRVTMPDGSKWDVPARVIATSRADYYYDQDFGISQENLYYQALSSDYKLIDWAENNMDWSDVAECAVKVEEEPEPVDYQEGWVNGEKEIVLK